MRRLVLALSLVISAGPALSMEIPRIDVDRLCKEQATKTNRNYESYDECFSRRQNQYDALKEPWAKVGDNVQRECWSTASSILVHAYYQARLCIEEELRLRERRAESEARAAKVREIPAREMKW